MQVSKKKTETNDRGKRTIDMHRHLTEQESSVANYHLRRQKFNGIRNQRRAQCSTTETVLHITRLARTTKSYNTKCWWEWVEIKPLHYWCGKLNYCSSSREPSGNFYWSHARMILWLSNLPLGHVSRRNCPWGETANFSLWAVSLTSVENSVSAVNLRGYSGECFWGSLRVHTEAYGKYTWYVHLLD